LLCINDQITLITNTTVTLQNAVCPTNVFLCCHLKVTDADNEFLIQFLL